MPEFQKVVQNPNAPYADLISDPSDPAVHQLPLEPGTAVKSIDPNGFPFETCPPVNCTSDDVVQSVMSHTTLWATSTSTRPTRSTSSTRSPTEHRAVRPQARIGY